MFSLAATPFGAAQGVHVWTQHNDNTRTGRNLNETVLKPDNVNEAQFGKLFTMPVDGAVYAQPLFLSNVLIGGKHRDVVFVATEHDSVFAFDAAVPGDPLWQVSFLNGPGVTTVPNAHPEDPKNPNPIPRYFDMMPEIGITGTPVIAVDADDASRSTLYVVAKTQETSGGAKTIVQRLHALDVTTGAEKFGGPVPIEAKFPGTGNGSDIPRESGMQGDKDGQGNVVFGPAATNGPLIPLQRSGLLLADGVVYIAFASHGDHTPYHGWLLGYDAQTLKQRSVFNSTPDGGRGGIWQTGVGPAADGASIYFATGNGTFDGKRNYGDSVVKLSVTKGSTADMVTVGDFFTPFNQSDLEKRDLDLGSGAVLLLPNVPNLHPSYAVTAGKQGVIYVLDRNNLGKFNDKKDQVVQRLPTAPTQASPLGEVYGAAAYYNGSLYYLGVNDSEKAAIKQFKFENKRLSETVVSRTRHLFANRGSSPAVSANGTSDAIVWFVEAGGFTPSIPATLHAYDARDLSNELYNSDQAVTETGAKRDQPGIGVKFAVPTIANGRVYVGTQGLVAVYGQLGRG
jgi:hypothetical protein